MTERLTHFQEDVLADILQSIHLQSTLYCRATMSAPWGFRVSERAVASFHIVTGGTCWLTVERTDTSPVLLTEGDLVILPHGHAHSMTDHPQTPVTRLEELVAKKSVEKDGMFYSVGQGAVTALVCGGLQLEDHATNPLFSLLPPLLHLKSQNGQSHPWLGAIVQVVKAEASANQLAAKTVITRFSESACRVQHFPRSSSSWLANLPCSTSPVCVSRRRLLCCARSRRHWLKSLPLSATTLRSPSAKRLSDNMAWLPALTGKANARHQRLEHARTVITFSESFRVSAAFSVKFEASPLPPQRET